MSHADLLIQLADVCGEAHVLTSDDHDLITYELDQRRRERGQALAVVRPPHTQAVADVVRLCAAFRQHHDPLLGLVPQGGHTGLVLGGTPDPSGHQIVLSLQRLNALRHRYPHNHTLIAEAGMTLQQVQQHAAEDSLLFPLSMASEGSCTIGGNLATNAGGTQVLRWGTARSLCLGLEVVTAQGDVWHGLSGLRKNNMGYDLRDLFIGSEGTLGIITAAHLKLEPMPQSRCSAWVVLPHLNDALALLEHTQRRLGAWLTGFEWINATALATVAQHLVQPIGIQTALLQPWQTPTPHPSTLLALKEDCLGAGVALVEISHPQSHAPLMDQWAEVLTDFAPCNHSPQVVIAPHQAASEQMWQLREFIPRAQALSGLNLKHDISLPIDQLVCFCETIYPILGCFSDAKTALRVVNFGHLGDGNLHFNIQASDPSQSLLLYEADIQQAVLDVVMQLGGSISAEHGIGRLKVAALAHYLNPTALQLMKTIKQALDPLGLLNPNRIII